MSSYSPQSPHGGGRSVYADPAAASSSPRRSVTNPDNGGSSSSATPYETLQSDNKLLAMKLKYLQSVTTIYRQRIAGITKDALVGMGFGPDHERRINGAIGEAEDAALSAIRQFDAREEEEGGEELRRRTGGAAAAHDNNGGASSPTRAAQVRAMLYGPIPSLTHNQSGASGSSSSSEADFWRQQFLNLMSEMRPVSVHDAELLMKALSDKKALSDEVDALRASAAMGGGGGGGIMKGSSHVTPARSGGGGGAMAADGTSPAPRKVTIAASSGASGAAAADLVTSPTPATANNASRFATGSSAAEPQIGMVLVTPQAARLGSAAASGGFVGSGTVTLGPDDGAGPMQYPSMQPTTLAQALQALQEEQTRNKVQRVRMSALQKQLNAREEEFTKEHVSTRTENLRIIAAMKALEKDRELLAQQNHDYRQQLYVSEKTVSVKEGQLQRQMTRTTAVEKELQASVKRMQTVFEQETDRRAAEAAALQQAFDEQRRLQTEIQLLKANLEGARRQQEDSDIEIQRLQIINTSTEKINEELRAEINKMEQARLMSEWEADSMLSLLPRMDESTTELEQFFTFREVKIECERMNGQLRSINSVAKSLLELNKVIEARNKEIMLLRAEADRAVSLGVPPSVTAVVDTQLVDGHGERKRAASPDGTTTTSRPKPHMMLRQQGTWMEIRDTGSGRLVYVTSNVSDTPFCPLKVATAEEKAREAKAKAEEQERAHQAALQKAREEEEARAAAIAKAVAEERAKYEAEAAKRAAEREEEDEANNSAAINRKKPKKSSKVNASAPIDPAYRPRLIRVFNKYNPARLNTIDIVMDRFRGRYDEMMAKLVAKYGPEPEDDGEALPELPPQVAEVPSVAGSLAGRDDDDDDDASGGQQQFIKPLRERLIRLLDSYDKPKLAAVDSFLNSWIEEGLLKLVAQYGLEPEADEDAPLPTLPPQLLVGGDPAKDVQLAPYRRRLIRLLDQYDKARLAAVDALMRQHPTPLQAETMLKKLTVRYGPEPIDDEDAKVPALPPQLDEVPPITATGASALYPTAATVASVMPGAGSPTRSAFDKSRAATPQEQSLGAADGAGGSASPDNILSPAMPPNAPSPYSPTVAAVVPAAPPPDVRPRLYRMFKRYAPEKLGNIDLVINSFDGEYDLMFKKLVAKYGPEPEDDGEAMPELPAQVVNPVLEARKRATSMRQPAPPSSLPGKRQPVVTVASPTKTPLATAATASPTAGSPTAGSAASSPKAAAAHVPTKAVIPRPVATPSSPTAAPSSPGSTSPRATKAPPPAALAAMKAAAANPSPAVAATADSRAASPGSTTPRTAKAPPPAALAAMKAAAANPVGAVPSSPRAAPAPAPSTTDAGGKTPSPPPAAAKAPPPAALAAMKAAAAAGSASPPGKVSPAPGASPRTAKAPPPAALAAMKAAQAKKPPAINTDDI